MLTLFNETRTPWSFTSINDYMSKISTTVTDRNNTRRTLDLLLSTDVKIDNCDTIVSSDTCHTLFDGNTLIKYQKKDFSPMVVHNVRNEFNTDTLALSFNLEGKVVREIKNTKNARIFNHFFKKGILALVVNLNAEESVYKFEITFFDKKNNVDVIYAFTRNAEDTAYGVEITTNEVSEDDIIENPTYKIMHYRPLRPTTAMFVRSCDREVFDNVIENQDRFVITTFDTNDELTNAIEELKANKYKAVTLFINKDRDTTSADTTAFNTIRDAFRTMLIINSNTGRVSIIK